MLTFSSLLDDKENFVTYRRKNNKLRFDFVTNASVKACRSLIVAVNGPSLDYDENPTQDFEHDRKKTWKMLRVLTEPQYANKITEITFARVDLLSSNIFAQSSMVDFPDLSRLRILNCRDFGLMEVALNDWSFIAKRGIVVEYSWDFTKIPRTFSCPRAGVILSRMFKWRLEKDDAGKKAIFDNLKTNWRLRRNIDFAFKSHWVPQDVSEADAGFCNADDLHDFVFKGEKKMVFSTAVVKIIHGWRAQLVGNLARDFTCRDCDVEMTGACFPKAQIHGLAQETPLCYSCQYDEQVYYVTEATSSRVSAIPFNDGTSEVVPPPRTLNEVARKIYNIPPRPIIQRHLNTKFNEVCPLSLKNMPCPHYHKQKACHLEQAYVSLYLYFPTT